MYRRDVGKLLSFTGKALRDFHSRLRDDDDCLPVHPNPEKATPTPNSISIKRRPPTGYLRQLRFRITRYWKPNPASGSFFDWKMLEETTWGVAETLRAWVEKYGVPRALYVDWKKMRLQGIATYDEANCYVRDTYLPRHNAKYSVEARGRADYHERLPRSFDLKQVFCLEEERKVSNDWVVQYGTRWLQIERERQKVAVKAGNTVVVREQREGSLTLWLNEKELRWHELAERPKRAAPQPKRRVVSRPRPAPDHPWRKGLGQQRNG